MTRHYPYHDVDKVVPFETLVGKTLKSVSGRVGDDEITFTCADGEEFTMFHYQDCCESVLVDDIVGDLDDLLDTPIVSAVESCDSGEDDVCDSYTWTFYRISTIKGTVVIKWYGSSNGYYSEAVFFARLK